MIKCRHIFFSEGLVNESNLLKIAICDNKQEAIQSLKNKLYEIMKSANIDGAVEEFKQLSEFKKCQIVYDIVFLSLDICENNVIQTVSSIKRKCLHSKLVLMSENSKYMQDAYKVQPFRYLLYTDSKEQIEETICSAVIENESRKGFLLEENGKFYTIFLKNVLYIEALGDEIVIITDDQEQFIIRMTLKDIYFRLEKDFVRCSRERIVNMIHIKEIEDREIILKGGLRITVSYREKKNVIEKCKDYRFRLMGELNLML